MFIKLVRIGRDAELRYTPAGKTVCNVACAYDVGWGENKRTGWIDGVLWEKRAEALGEYLKKGQQAHVTFDDLEIEKWEGNNGSGAKLKGRIVDIILCGAKPKPATQQTQTYGQQQAQKVPQQQGANGQQSAVDEFFDDDIGF